ILHDYTTLCGVIASSSDGASAVITKGAEVPAYDSHGSWKHAAEDAEITCHADQVVVGFTGALGELPKGPMAVTQLALRCAPLTLSGDVNTGFEVEIGAITETDAVGTRTDTSIPDTDCPPGEVAVGSIGSAGDILDAIGLLCDEIKTEGIVPVDDGGVPLPSIYPPNTDKPLFMDACPGNQVMIGIRASVSFGYYNSV